MKRYLSIIVLLAILLAVPALAEPETFGGDLDWPTFHGMQLGLSMPYVLLQEEYVNGYKPELVKPSGKTLEEISAEDLTKQIYYRIGYEEIYGVECEIIYLFEDNVFLRAQVKGDAGTREAANEWTAKMQELFDSLYGERATEGHWQKRSSQLPYNITLEWEGHMGNYKTREYIWPEAGVKVDGDIVYDAEEQGNICEVSAAVNMRYICNDFENVMFAFNGDWDGEEIFKDDGKQTDKGLTVEEIRKMLGEYASDLLDAKYHDSRYYR